MKLVSLLFACATIASCGGTPTPQYTPEEQAQIDKERVERAAIEIAERRQRLEAESKKIPMFQLSDLGKFAAVVDFDAIWSGRSVCSKVIDLGYPGAGWLIARCESGELFPVSIRGDETWVLTCERTVKFYGVNCYDAVWLLGLEEDE